MDLFTAVAERMQEGPAEIRPVVMTPYEMSRQEEGFDMESIEVDAPMPATATRRTAVPSPEIEPASEKESPLEASVSRISLPLPTDQPLVTNPSPIQPVEVPNAAAQKNELSPVEPPAASTPNFQIPAPFEPIERLIQVSQESPVQPVPTSPAPGLTAQSDETQPAANSTTIHNEFFTELHSTTIENQNLSIQNVEIDASTTKNESLTTIQTEGPRIEIPATPIEVAVHSPIHNTQIIQEMAGGAPMLPAVGTREESVKTVVDIKIGRIEVNAIKGPPPGRRPAASTQPNSRLSLDDVLKKRRRT